MVRTPPSDQAERKRPSLERSQQMSHDFAVITFGSRISACSCWHLYATEGKPTRAQEECVQLERVTPPSARHPRFPFGLAFARSLSISRLLTKCGHVPSSMNTVCCVTEIKLGN